MTLKRDAFKIVNTSGPKTKWIKSYNIFGKVYMEAMIGMEVEIWSEEDVYL